MCFSYFGEIAPGQFIWALPSDERAYRRRARWFWMTGFNYRNTGQWHSTDQSQLTISQSPPITRWWAQSDQLAVKRQQCHISYSDSLPHDLHCWCKYQRADLESQAKVAICVLCLNRLKYLYHPFNRSETCQSCFSVLAVFFHLQVDNQVSSYFMILH